MATKSTIQKIIDFVKKALSILSKVVKTITLIIPLINGIKSIWK